MDRPVEIMQKSGYKRNVTSLSLGLLALVGAGVVLHLLRSESGLREPFVFTGQSEAELARENPLAIAENGSRSHPDDDEIFEARDEQDTEDDYRPAGETPAVPYEYNE